jgi:hypothetical protein
MLLFSNRMATGPTNKPTTALFASQYALPVQPSTPKSHRRLGQVLKAIENRWRIDHSSVTASSYIEITSCALEKQRQSLLEQRSGRLYKYLGPPEQTASYILIEPRRIARLRARIRLNRPSFNASLFTRRIVSNSTCPFCASHEDVQHVLLECHAYAAARLRLSNALWSLAIDDENAGWSLFGSLPGVRAATGDVSHVPGKHRRAVLRSSADFLSAINALRPI